MYIILIIFSTVAACMSIFMVLHIVVISKKLNNKKILLVLFILALTLRVLKSVFYFLLYPDLSVWFLFFGFLGFSLMGPLAYMYYKLDRKDNKKDFVKNDLIHFFFPFMGLLIIFRFPNQAETLYLLCLFSLAIYLTFSYKLVTTKFKESNSEQRWDFTLFKALLALLVSFLIPYLVHSSISYAIGTATASIIIFILFFYFLKYSPKLIKNDKKQKVSLKQEEQIIATLEEKKAYKDPSITLHSLSVQLEIPKYIISDVIKAKYGKSFYGCINSHRIAEAKKVLEDKSIDMKIETLAYDVGFNTLSAFYSVFKKETKMSPREYQRTIHS